MAIIIPILLLVIQAVVSEPYDAGARIQVNPYYNRETYRDPPKISVYSANGFETVPKRKEMIMLPYRTPEEAHNEDDSSHVPQLRVGFKDVFRDVLKAVSSTAGWVSSFISSDEAKARMMPMSRQEFNKTGVTRDTLGAFREVKKDVPRALSTAKMLLVDIINSPSLTNIDSTEASQVLRKIAIDTYQLISVGEDYAKGILDVGGKPVIEMFVAAYLRSIGLDGDLNDPLSVAWVQFGKAVLDVVRSGADLLHLGIQKQRI